MAQIKSRGFTLVELLVVITIIGILASLITVAAVGALKKAGQARIKIEVDKLADAFEQYKNEHSAYPPNGQIDGVPQTERPLDELKPSQDFIRHMREAFPRQRESDDLLRVMTGVGPAVFEDYPKVLGFGLGADEAIVFWLGGFSSDENYPISGEGGPAYPIPAFDDPQNRTLDPIESRQWLYPFDVSRLGPRDEDGYFKQQQGGVGQFIEYRDPRGNLRRINFWRYMPPNSQQPFLYFNTSRNPAAVIDEGEVVSRHDPPARHWLAVYAFKKASQSTGSPVPIEFFNPNKFQIMHCGIDDEWGEEEFKLMRAHGVELAGKDPSKADNYLLFPNGPFTGAIADTVVNFAAETSIGDAQQ